jgi:tight adherence protein C
MTTLYLLIGIGAVFAGIVLCLYAMAVLNDGATGVGKSLAMLEAISTAPEALAKEADKSFNDRVLTPTLNRFVGIGRRITPKDYGERIKAKLDVAGNPPGWTVDRIIALKVVGIVPGLIVGILVALMLHKGALADVVLCAGGGLAGYFAPNLWLYQKGYDRVNKMQRALPDAIDLLTISVEAGLGFDAAVAQVARNTDGPLANEFARMLQEMQIGLGRSEALRALGERCSLPDLKTFASSMVQADKFGIPVAQVLRVQSSEIRLKRRQRAEEKAQQIPVKIMIPLVLFILPTLFVAVMGPAVISILGIFGNGGIMH